MSKTYNAYSYISRYGKFNILIRNSNKNIVECCGFESLEELLEENKLHESLVNEINILPEYIKLELDNIFIRSIQTTLSFVPHNADFSEKALQVISEIPSGETLTYSEVAEKAGNKKAFRAVANVCAKNRYPILIPCHRVTGKSSKYLYGYGEEMKKEILEFEEKLNRQV